MTNSNDLTLEEMELRTREQARINLAPNPALTKALKKYNSPAARVIRCLKALVKA